MAGKCVRHVTGRQGVMNRRALISGNEDAAWPAQLKDKQGEVGE
jgi:hypothetical protein